MGDADFADTKTEAPVQSVHINLSADTEISNAKKDELPSLEDCNKMFKNEKNLRHHYKTHHEQPHPAKNDSEEKEPRELKNTGRTGVKKEKKEPPKYPCHMCDIPVMFALTALR